MSIPPSADARAPQRQRGRLRVAAILEAGAAAFREKGYDAVTMTEIAARSGTTFGSLYRFFLRKRSWRTPCLLNMLSGHWIGSRNWRNWRRP